MLWNLYSFKRKKHKIYYIRENHYPHEKVNESMLGDSLYKNWHRTLAFQTATC